VGISIIKFFIWGRQFFNAELHGRRRRGLGLPDISHFLDSLASNQSAEAWQIAQAEKALFIYYEQFRGVKLVDSMQEQAEGRGISMISNGPV